MVLTRGTPAARDFPRSLVNFWYPYMGFTTHSPVSTKSTHLAARPPRRALGVELRLSYAGDLNVARGEPLLLRAPCSILNKTSSLPRTTIPSNTADPGPPRLARPGESSLT